MTRTPALVAQLVIAALVGAAAMHASPTLGTAVEYALGLGFMLMVNLVLLMAPALGMRSRR